MNICGLMAQWEHTAADRSDSKLVNKTGEGIILDIVLGIVGGVVGVAFSRFGAHGVTVSDLYTAWSLQ